MHPSLENSTTFITMISRLESYARGDYVHVPKPEPKPEMPIDEIILKMQQEMEFHEMSISEREGIYYHGGFVGQNDPKLAQKADQIKDGEGFVVSKWINLRNHGALAIPKEKFAEDLVQMNIVFKAFHYYSPDGLHRFARVTEKLTDILLVKFPAYNRKLLQKFSLSRTIFRMRNMQRNTYVICIVLFLTNMFQNCISRYIPNISFHIWNSNKLQ